MSRNISLTSTAGLSSNTVCTSHIIVIERIWPIHKSPGRKPDCEGSKKFVTLKMICKGNID